MDFKSPCLLPAEKIWTLNLSARHCTVTVNYFSEFTLIKVRMGPGPTFPVGKEIPVISPVLTVRAVQIGAPPWQSMRPMDKQEVRQVCSDRHETCILLFNFLRSTFWRIRPPHLVREGLCVIDYCTKKNLCCSLFEPPSNKIVL